jgi:hypothetical protein
MQVQRYGQLLQRGPDLLVPRFVEVVACEVVVDQRAAESELADGAAEFFRRGLRVLRGQRGEPAEPVRMSGHDPGQVVVGEPGMVPRGRRVGVGLHAGDGERQHLDVDTRRVHVRQPVLGELRELAFHVRDKAFAEHDLAGAPGRGPLFRQFRDGKVFFQGDVPHRGRPS